MARTDDLVSTVARLDATVAELQRLGAARWGAGNEAWVAVGGGGGAPAFENAWANFTAVGGWAPARYRRTGGATGWVEIQGLVTRGGGPGFTVFTLPVGYRPAGNVRFVTVIDGSTSSGWGYLNISSTGTVALAAGSSAGATTPAASIACSFGLG